jgi:hypothetical protein
MCFGYLCNACLKHFREKVVIMILIIKVLKSSYKVPEVFARFQPKLKIRGRF